MSARYDLSLSAESEEPFYDNNVHLHTSLPAKSIPHHLRVWEEEAHRPRYWRAMVQHYL